LPAPEDLEVSPRRRSSKRAAPSPDLSPQDETLLETLRAWRLKAAHGKPAYTVANNRTLEAIASERPADLDALAQIHGVGPAFLKRHGEDVLELLAA
jgi:ATP-dependent DNA helicase RecQ